MKNVVKAESLPYDVQEIEHTWITMRDGCRLSARIWLPAGATESPVPAILEYIPYRTRDLKRFRDTQMHAYFAGHGYASIRVDMRGSGDSEGVLEDEYLLQEQEDGEDILTWLEEQPWCNGRVGMIGISWGGFNGLQMAARKPPQLQAVITVCSTDDRYADDVHYMGGALLGNNLSWASRMFGLNSLPPDPAIVGDQWKDMWHDRLNHSGLWVDHWMSHQHRDDYWKHGSICENYDDITCPVMAVGGWADGYSNPIYRMMAHLNVPRKGLIGPWAHNYPQDGSPGPAIGFMQESLRWWDQWLKDKDTSIMDEPMIRSWMQDFYEPLPERKDIPGRWIAEPQWPSPHVAKMDFSLEPGKLVTERNEDRAVYEPFSIASPLSVGMAAGKWYSSGSAPDLPTDQRVEDGGSALFESRELTETVEIHGAPVIELELSSDKPVAMVAVRLVDVAPDQTATRVTYGVLNLCHRNSHEHPEPLTPGKKETVQVTLNDIAHSFKAGHRIRLAVSTVYWPLAWASPEPVKLTIYPENSRLTLPVRKSQPIDDELPAFQDPEVFDAPQPEEVTPSDKKWTVTHDIGEGQVTLETVDEASKLYFKETGHDLYSKAVERYSYKGNQFDSLRGEVEYVWALNRDDWQIQTKTRTVVTCDKDNFYIYATLDAYEKDEHVFTKTWDRTIRRELV